MQKFPPVCDYEGSDYRTRFWENQGREYEDQSERVALRRLMPPRGGTLLDVGAGFGRLADEYRGYDRVVLLDYSESLLREGRERLKDDPRFIFVAADWYKMPFINGVFDTLVQVRTLHHAADAPALLTQLGRVTHHGSSYILEFANKHNLKAMARHALGKQSWSPYDLDPIEFVELNFDFHPKWIRSELKKVSFAPIQTLTTSHFRIGILKKTIPTSWLVKMDSIAQRTGDWWQLSPSVFVSSQKEGGEHNTTGLFACPECQTALGREEDNALPCDGCGLRWPIRDGIHIFKEPL